MLRVNAGQLDALQRDADVDHLSGDIPIRGRRWRSTNAAIGADQVWAGAGDVPALTGSGVTVAVIDSGIERPAQRAAASRVLATVDFTGGDGMDRYGHGTHVAAIIAGQAGRDAGHARATGAWRPARISSTCACSATTGPGRSSDVIEAIDWAIEHQAQYNIRRHQPVARRAGAAAVPRRSAVRGGGAGGARRASSWWRRPATTGRTADGRHGVRRHHVAGQRPVRADGGRARHARHGRAVRRHGGDVQLARADAVRPGDEAGRGGARAATSCRRRRPGPYLSTDAIPSGTWPAAGRTRYIQLSGTSMAAAVVSGAVALLLRGATGPDAGGREGGAAADQLVPAGGGLLTGGAGSLNVLAAASFVASGYAELPATTIAGERIAAIGLTVLTRRSSCPPPRSQPDRLALRLLDPSPSHVDPGTALHLNGSRVLD